MSGQASYAFLINLICLGATAIDPASTVSTTNSPVRLQATMPAPAGINSLCLDEWSGHKELILQKRDSLYYAILDKEKLNTSREKIQQEIALLKQRWLLLDNVIKRVSMLEHSDVEYVLKSTAKGEGSTSWDTRRKCIVLTVGSTANFIHEAMHGWHYETGEIMFDANFDKSYLADLVDETEAYKAQFAYDPASITSLRSKTIAYAISDITTEWVAGLQSADGEKTYREHSRIRVNINSPKPVLLMAYPHLESQFINWADTWTMKQVPNTIYKKHPVAEPVE